jgi:hypothetical protein
MVSLQNYDSFIQIEAKVELGVDRAAKEPQMRIGDFHGF